MKIYQIHYSESKHIQKLRLAADTPQSFGITDRGGLEPKSLCGNEFSNATKTAKKASLPLKMYLKSLAILEKASFTLKKSYI
jgi:hypothetical protein